jgi:cell division protein FtsQ
VVAFDMRSPPRLYMRLPDGETEGPKIAANTEGAL